jgi:hypothetical protein
MPTVQDLLSKPMIVFGSGEAKAGVVLVIF